MIAEALSDWIIYNRSLDSSQLLGDAQTGLLAGSPGESLAGASQSGLSDFFQVSLCSSGCANQDEECEPAALGILQDNDGAVCEEFVEEPSADMSSESDDCNAAAPAFVPGTFNCRYVSFGELQRERDRCLQDLGNVQAFLAARPLCR